MADPLLTPEQEAEAQRLAVLIGQKAQEEALRMARILVSEPDAQLLGATSSRSATGRKRLPLASSDRPQ